MSKGIHKIGTLEDPHTVSQRNQPWLQTLSQIIFHAESLQRTYEQVARQEEKHKRHYSVENTTQQAKTCETRKQTKAKSIAQVPLLQPELRLSKRPGAPHEDPHERASLQLRGLRQDVQAARPPHPAHDLAHRLPVQSVLSLRPQIRLAAVPRAALADSPARAEVRPSALPVRRLQEDLRLQGHPGASHCHAHAGEAIRLQGVRQEVQTVGARQDSHAGAH